jgi:hypothetical protein
VNVKHLCQADVVEETANSWLNEYMEIQAEGVNPVQPIVPEVNSNIYAQETPSVPNVVTEKQAETGLTEEQKRNVDVMDGLKKKYPDAFEKIEDSKKRKVLVVNSSVDPSSKDILTKDKFVSLWMGGYENGKRDIKNVDWDKFGDWLEKFGDGSNFIYKKSDNLEGNSDQYSVDFANILTDEAAAAENKKADAIDRNGLGHLPVGRGMIFSLIRMEKPNDMLYFGWNLRQGQEIGEKEKQKTGGKLASAEDVLKYL